jgi:hypothetical protein
MKLPEKRSSVVARIQPLLKGLDTRAQRTALLVCFYAAPRDPEFLREIDEARDRERRASRALRKLRTELLKIRTELESTLGDAIISLCETIRSAHIPSGSSALLPIPELSGLGNYYRLKGIPDPAESLERFLKLWPEIELFARREIDFFRSHNLGIRDLLGQRLRHSWRHGRLEYVLYQLFTCFSSRKMSQKHIEEQIELISQELYGTFRQIDPERGGCQAVREAVMRVRKNKQHKEQCESFLKSRLTVPEN